MKGVLGDSHHHVIFLIPTLTGGGAERVVVTVLRALDRSRFKATLAVVDTRDAVFRSEVPTDVDFVDLNSRRVRYALPKIVALIWKRRPDVVFSTLGHLNLALVMLRPLLPRQPKYIARETTIVSESVKRSWWPWLWRWMYRQFYGKFDFVVCQSKAMLDDLVDNLGLDNLHATVIHNPVDVGRIRQLAGQPLCDDGLWFENAKDSMVLRVVAAGRLVEEKGFDLLIEAVGLLNDDRIRLAILGDGPQRASLERLASDRGVKDRVRFVGFQANPFAWFARADVFVLSSRYEGFPNVVLEALACRTPVIATPAPGGTREILEQIPECRLAKAVSVQALADAIRQWGYVRRVPVPEEVVEPYRLSTVIGRYEALFGSS